MADFPSVLIDPYILCLDSYASNFDDFVEKVTSWLQLTTRVNIDLLFSEDCMLSMYKDQCFPDEHRVREYYKQHACDYIDEDTLCSAVAMIITRTPYFEEASGHKCALFDEDKAEIQPDILSRLNQNVRNSFLTCLHAFSVWKNNSNNNCVIGSITSEFSQPFDGYLCIRSSVFEIEPYSTDHNFNYQYPLSLDHHYPLFNCFDEIIYNIDVIEIWNSAKDEQAVKDCIDRKINLLLTGGLTGTKKNYFLGDNLINSLKTWGFDSREDWARNFIDSCARIILGHPKSTVRDLKKKDTTGKKLPIIRDVDHAKAKRTHLTKRSEGFRLMFWQLPNSSIEFANVGDKDELRIF